MSLETKVETIRGDFRRASEFVGGTWQSSAEITKDRITNKSLRNETLYTNNSALYGIEDNDAFLYFGSKDNSIFRKDTIDKAFNQLRSNETNHYYSPPEEDATKAKHSSLKLRISDLELKFDDMYISYGYIKVNTSDLTGSKFKTDAQRRFAEAVYGSMEQDAKGNSDYSRAMQMLNSEGIKTARIYSLREETVLEDAKRGAVARACWLDNFVGNSYFGAYGRDVGDDFALRGVCSVAEGDARKEMSPITQAYNTILKTPVIQLQAEATPDVIEKMLSLVANYVHAHKQ